MNLHGLLPVVARLSRRWVEGCVGGIAALALAASAKAQVPALRVVNPGSIPYDVRSLAAGDGRFVAGVGVSDLYNPGATFGALYSSADGIVWEQTLASTHAFVAVAHGAGVWVANDSQGWIHRSTDGRTWQRIRQDRSYWAMAHGAGLFVALPSQGPLSVSNNGTAWSNLPNPVADYSLNCIAFGNGRFVGIGLPGVSITSTDGRTWSTARGPALRANSIAFGAGRFVASGTRTDFVDRDPAYATSTDGLEWTELTLPVARGAQSPATVTFAGDRFFAVGKLGSNRPAALWTSFDGLAWQVREDAIRTSASAVAHNGDRYVAVGPAGGRSHSPDGITWTALDTVGSPDLATAVWFGNHWYAFAVKGEVWRSGDGSFWSAVGKLELPSDIVAAAASPTMMMVLSKTGELGVFQPESGWRIVKGFYVSGEDMFSLIYADGMWLAGCWGGVYHSRDGQTWPFVNLGLNNLVRGVSHGAGHYWAAGSKGVVAKSIDGKSWTQMKTPSDQDFYGVSAVSGKVVAVGQGGVIVSSADGVGWSTEVEAETGFSAKHLKGVCYARGLFLAAGMARALWSSDGKNWQQVTPFPGTSAAINAVAAHGGTAIVLADRGLIATAEIPATRIRNLSVLARVQGASDAIALGYIIAGRDRALHAPVVVRAVGPTLAALGVQGPAADPRLECYAGTSLVAENDDWRGADLAAAMLAVGAFPLTAESRDAAGVISVPHGQNTVVARAADSGAVLAEVYDATPHAGLRGATPFLANVSLLKRIGDGLTAGFVVSGTTPIRVLIRAAGPALEQFGIQGYSGDPSITVFRNGTPIAANNDWGGTAALREAFATVGAFTFPAASRDSAAVLELLPGDYSIEVKGHVEPAGTVLVEVYALPQLD